jgi:hypothetical protein
MRVALVAPRREHEREREDAPRELEETLHGHCSARSQFGKAKTTPPGRREEELSSGG